MSPAKRRDRATVTGELLETISRASARGETRLSHVAMECNLPYDRFKELILELQQRRLLDHDNPLRLTSEGRTLLGHYRQWMESLRLFGIGDEPATPTRL